MESLTQTNRCERYWSAEVLSRHSIHIISNANFNARVKSQLLGDGDTTSDEWNSTGTQKSKLRFTCIWHDFKVDPFKISSRWMMAWKHCLSSKKERPLSWKAALLHCKGSHSSKNSAHSNTILQHCRPRIQSVEKLGFCVQTHTQSSQGYSNYLWLSCHSTGYFHLNCVHFHRVGLHPNLSFTDSVTADKTAY